MRPPRQTAAVTLGEFAWEPGSDLLGESAAIMEVSGVRPVNNRRKMPQPLVVMKFGGTSVGSAQRIDHATELIRRCAAENRVVVVVSAMSKITDLLLDTMKLAAAGEESEVESNLATLRERHLEAAAELLGGEALETARGEIEALVDGFARTARGMAMLRERPPRSVDEAVTAGERLCALLVSAVLRKNEIASEAVNAVEVIVTDAEFGDASPLMEETARKAAARLGPLLENEVTPIVTGFNGAAVDGRPTTLGRGGSDFSAAILAAVLEADELWIWTDVDGILTADPRLVADARVLAEVSYNEAAELAYNGAKVLHPRTLAPLVEKGIPVWIKNSFDAAKPGTRIVSSITADHGVRAITSLAKSALITIEAANASTSGAQLMSRALGAAARANVEVLLMTRSSFWQNFCMLVRSEELADALAALREELSLELEHGYVHPIEVDHSVGLLAAVGEGMRGTPGLAGDVFTALSRHRINIIAIAQGSSELTIAIVVTQKSLDQAVRALHESCGLGALDEETA